MKLPGPDHPISIVPNRNRVRVTLAGKLIADTRRALTLSEAHYKPVQYIPREDADMAALKPTAQHSASMVRRIIKRPPSKKSQAKRCGSNL